MSMLVVCVCLFVCLLVYLFTCFFVFLSFLAPVSASKALNIWTTQRTTLVELSPTTNTAPFKHPNPQSSPTGWQGYTRGRDLPR